MLLDNIVKVILKCYKYVFELYKVLIMFSLSV